VLPLLLRGIPLVLVPATAGSGAAHDESESAITLAASLALWRAWHEGKGDPTEHKARNSADAIARRPR
jgi:hypothetical protein